jgi:C4-dicarboxylate transporter DctM subunit
LVTGAAAWPWPRVRACAGFGAICGSSLATAATMGQVALPQMREHNYSGRFATAAIAAGGTLGILIPPSVPLVIYAILTEQNIAKLFMAALCPASSPCSATWWSSPSWPGSARADAPAGDRYSWPQRLAALVDTWPCC